MYKLEFKKEFKKVKWWWTWVTKEICCT